MKRVAALALAWTLAIPQSEAARGIPDWLAEAGRRGLPPGAGRADAWVQHDEEIVEVPTSGRIVATTRWAVKVATHEGAEAAFARVGYVRGSSEVKVFHAWLLSDAGAVVQQWDRKAATDASDVERWELYSEFRHVEVTPDAVRPGQTFAYEAVVESDPLFAQWRWWFRAPYPSALSRFVISLPPGLDVTVHAAHLDSVIAHRELQTWRWEMHDQPAVVREEMMPDRPDLVPYLCVQAVSPSSDRSSAGVAFRDWPAAARWSAAMAAGQAEVTPDLAARAAQIAVMTDTLARIAALARFVQGLNYTAVVLNIGRGEGFRPHAASAVLRAGYGDCKDKANLLCTLLRAIGRDAWLVPVYARSRDGVDTAWASPQQFDHCIVAMRAPSEYRGPSLVDARRDRLVAFDPTDPITAFGDLPREEQGAWGLLARQTAGGLVRLPVMPAERNRVWRHVDAALDPTGRLDATLTENREGQAARDERERLWRSGKSEYQRDLEEWLSGRSGNVDIRSWSSTEDTLLGRYQLRIEYASPSFAPLAGNRMLTFRSALISSRHPIALGDSTRSTPIALHAESLVETLIVRLPAGFALDEVPADLHRSSDLGRLDATWAESSGTLVIARRWEVNPSTVGPERWHDVLDLYRALKTSNEALVVLLKR